MRRRVVPPRRRPPRQPVEEDYIPTPLSPFAAALVLEEETTRQGNRLYDEGVFLGAAECWDTSLRVLEQAFGPDSRQCAFILHNLGSAHSAQGNYQQAEELFARALAIKERVFGADTDQYALTLNNLATLRGAQGRYQQAEFLYAKPLTVNEQPDSRQCAATLHNLASLYADQGNYEQAQELYARALTINEQELGPDSPQYADTLHSVATLHTDQGNYHQAEELYARALAIKERVFGADSHQYADTLHGLASLRSAQGRYQQAEKLYARTLAIREQVFGSNSHQYADTLHSSGLLQLQLRRFERSLEYLERADFIYRTLDGGSCPKVAMSLCAHGELHYEQGDFPRAVDKYQKALTIHATLSGVGSYRYLTTLVNLGAMYFDQGRHGQAIECFDRAFRILESEFEHMELKGRVLTHLGDVFYELETYEQAEACYQYALGIYRPDIHHPGVRRRYVTVLLSMGFLHTQCDNRLRARKLFNKVASLRLDKKPSLLISPTHCQDYDALGSLEQALETTRQFGERSPKCAQALRNLASWYALPTRFEVQDLNTKLDANPALNLYQEALLIYTRLDDGSPEHQILLAATHHSLGRLHLEGAVDNFLRALEIYERIHGRDCRQCAMTRAHLAECYLDLHDEDDNEQPDYLQAALENYREALRINTLVFGPNSRQCADIFASLGRVHEEQAEQAEEKCEEPEEFWRRADWSYARALRIYKMVLGMDSRQYVETMEMRGKMLERQGQSERGQHIQSSAGFVKRQLELGDHHL